MVPGTANETDTVRLLIILLLAIPLAFGTLFALLTFRLFVSPPVDNPAHVDAVVVLSGDMGERMSEARRLIAAGKAPVLVYAGSPDSQEVIHLCTQRQELEVVCLQRQPDSTRAEARAVGNLARSRDWNSIAVVTTSWHAARAGLLFRRCVEGDVYTFGAFRAAESRRAFVRNVVLEWLGVLYALTLERQC